MDESKLNRGAYSPAIREIVRQLEDRVAYLLEDFKAVYATFELIVAEDININIEEDPRCAVELGHMVEIFTELKPVERIVRHKHPEYGDIFTQIAKIEFERANGKFFSFLAVMPGLRAGKRLSMPKAVSIAPTLKAPDKLNG